MHVSVSRRAFLAGLGSGVASAALVWGLGRSGVWSDAPVEAYPVAACCGTVTHSGWLLTAEDRERLTAAGQMTLLDATSFQGGDISSDIVANAEACEAWCAGNLDCRSFTFASAAHPQADMRNRCWIKNARDLPAIDDPIHVSGVR
jgi:hypothetical protein